MSVTTAPPHPPRYPSPVIHNTPPGHYNEEENNPPLKPPIRKSIQQTKPPVHKPAKILHGNKNNNNNSEEDDDSVGSFDEMYEDNTDPAQTVPNTISTHTGDDNNNYIADSCGYNLLPSS